MFLFHDDFVCNQWVNLMLSFGLYTSRLLIKNVGSFDDTITILTLTSAFLRSTL